MEKLSRRAQWRLDAAARKERKREVKRDQIANAQEIPSGRVSRGDILETIFIPRFRGQDLAFVGGGVSVGDGKLGYGLWATRDFDKNDLITQYEGVEITQKEIDLRKDEDKTHIASHRGQGGGIDGFKTPKQGRGGGSFANHSGTPNAELFRTEVGIFLKALVAIPKEHWIMISYGTRFLDSSKGKCHNLGTDRKDEIFFLFFFVVVSAPPSCFLLSRFYLSF